MKKVFGLVFIVVSIVMFSCQTEDGKWGDTIHLSTKAAVFSALGDSITIKTKGDWWWVSTVSVDTTWYYGFTGINLQSDNYKIKQACFDVERRDKNTLFIKVDANPNTVKRIIKVGLEDGDYFDNVTITQNPKR